jgi:hypothetical protein
VPEEHLEVLRSASHLLEVPAFSFPMRSQSPAPPGFAGHPPLRDKALGINTAGAYEVLFPKCKEMGPDRC